MKHVPERTCVGCHTTRPQSELMRVARTPDLSGLALDERRQLPGRGAYVCRDARCWQAAADRRSGLDRALRTSVPAAARQELLHAFVIGFK